MRNAPFLVFGLVLASLSLGACGGGSGGSMPGANNPQNPSPNPPPTRHSIKHIVLVIQENRTLNNLFAGFPGATTTKTGEELVQQGSKYVEQSVTLTEAHLQTNTNVTHRYQAFVTAYQNGAMDGFNLIKYIRTGKPVGNAPYQYVNPNDVKPYWAIAQQWGFANAMFQTQGSDSFTAHQDLIRGSTCISSAASCKSPSGGTLNLIDPPTTSAVWGCDSNAGAKTWVIDTHGKVSLTGPFPCSNKFPDYGSSSYETLRELLDAKQLSWKYYTPAWKS
ncbi:MAG TPA: alkaline phosphatase family protein, partial [Candidatus Nitrosotalea sp.]|nr:alkaline phosphatase family protein [Candidatus Nitrosotalea sp.]